MDLNYFIPKTTIELIVVAFITLATLLQAFYYRYYFNRLAKFKQSPSNSELPPVSVIICVKNEAENLSKFLPKVLTQSYPNYEVVVVNDGSSDDSELILAQLKLKYPNLYYTNIPDDKKFFHGKKLALSIGIKAAKNNHLLFTDADCCPTSQEWIKQMATSFKNKTEIVLGYSPYAKSKGLVNLLIRYDSFFIGVQYLNFAIAGIPYMGVGRNLAYTKEAFHRNGGFKNHLSIASGDDDLFISEVANKENTNIQPNIEGQTLSLPQQTFKGWQIQKSRHLTTSPLYKPGIKSLLNIEVFSRQVIYFGAICSIFFHNFVLIGLFALFLKLIIQLITLGKSAKRMGAGRVYWASLLFDFSLPFFLSTLYLRNRFRLKQATWK